MGWEWMTSEDWIKLLGQILGPLLAATVTGVLLVYQSRKNAQLAVDNHQRELAETRRKEDLQAKKESLQARREWAAAFQEVLYLCMTAVRLLRASRGNPDPEAAKVVAKAVDEYHAAFRHAKVANARLFVVEQDRIVVAIADFFVRSVGDSIKTQAELASIESKFDHVEASFLSVLNEFAGIGNPGAKLDVLKRLVQQSSLPQEVRNQILSAAEPGQAERKSLLP